MQSIFSTYTKNENRVTSTIMAVFSKLSLNSLNYVLQRICGEEDFKELIHFTNQKYLGSNGENSKSKNILDAEISANFNYLFETKIVAGEFADNVSQLENYICNQNSTEHTKLIVLTPDWEEPKKIKELESTYWLNFDTLYEILNELLEGKAIANEQKLLVFEYEKFLINELLQFFIVENLLAEDFKDKVLVVPANKAWEFYRNHGCYTCQPNRTFRNSNYMAFYSNGEIQQKIPQILGWIDSLNFDGNEILFDSIKSTLKRNENVTTEEADELIKKQLAALSQSSIRGEFKVIFLDNSDNVQKLSQVVKNSKKTASGKSTAFTQKQAYVSLKKLQEAKETSELV